VISDSEISRVLIWERNWFRRASMGELARRERREATTAGVSRLIARRLLRHAVWYLRARDRDKEDRIAARVLLQSLRRVQS
jgi:hypothetical protein